MSDRQFGSSLPTDFSCLAIETSSPVSSIAVCTGGRVARAEYGSPGEQSRQVYGCVRDVMRELSLELSGLDCIAFGRGPGGFTGLRVGAAVAQALAFGVGLPVCRVSSLAVLAAAAMREHRVERVAACIDARMGEAYIGVYRREGDRVVAELEDQLVTPATFTLPVAAGLFAAGGGWEAFPELAATNASHFEGIDTNLIPAADSLLSLAVSSYRDGLTVAPHEAIPNYVRNRVTS
jgi:tRNA threonylcarbamoyladenosine biosynthesis protein TsaB